MASPKLGQRGKDVITGFEGILTSREIPLVGATRYCLETESKDGKKPEYFWCDEGRIEITDKKVAYDPGIEKPIITLKLGSRARDKITGLTGTITSRHQSISGCEKFAIQPDVRPSDGKLLEGYYIDHSHIELLDTAKTAPERRAPAGPSAG